MPQIDALVRNSVWSRITDDTLGFNANVDAASGNYPDVDVALVKNDGWQMGTTCCWGLVAPAAVEQSSVMEYPFVAFDIIRASQIPIVISSDFSGEVVFMIQFHLSWSSEAILADFASYGDLVQDAMYASLNDPDNQLFGSGMTYRGNMGLARGPIAMGGDNWRQMLQFTGSFTVIQ
jgi:hypothetical protein